MWNSLDGCLVDGSNLNDNIHFLGSGYFTTGGSIGFSRPSNSSHFSNIQLTVRLNINLPNAECYSLKYFSWEFIVSSRIHLSGFFIIEQL
ncbi:unnamed protein product [Schistosoma margrebowiei]|uniref:Uncharacterized protein n=1 Tax=Schistosoma margrebowiei TaxID=48269 RepID=A0AA85AAG4_9TREM|nr:unnamed protein product [Schistosoma margrebowiei]